MQIQHVITQIVEKHGLDLTRAGSRLQLTLGDENWLEIECCAGHEVLVTHYQPSAHNTLLATPGIVFCIRNAEWTVLEIVQDKAKTKCNPGETVMTPPYTLLMNRPEMDAFLDRWAQILAQCWLPQAQPVSMQRKE